MRIQHSFCLNSFNGTSNKSTLSEWLSKCNPWVSYRGWTVLGRPICRALPVNRTTKLLYISYYIINFRSMYKIWGKSTEKCALCVPFKTTCGQSLADCSLGQFMMVFCISKIYINSSNNFSICFALYSAYSFPSSSSHSSLSPTTCRSVGFLRLLTPTNHAGVSLSFGCTGTFGFQAPGGSASHLSCHSARFWACFDAYQH